MLARTVVKRPIAIAGCRRADRFVCFALAAGTAREMANVRTAPQVAVIGAGIAGAVCSNFLAKRGAFVDVFDLGKRNPGGRLSSRTSRGTGGGGGGSGGPGLLQFDYGCQYFSAASPPVMRQLLAEWLEAGVVAEWRPRMGVYDVARGAVRPYEELTASEVAELRAGGLPALPAPGSGPLYVGCPSMAELVAALLRPFPHMTVGSPPPPLSTSLTSSLEGQQLREGPQPSQERPQGREQAGGCRGGSSGGGISLRLNTRVTHALWADNRWRVTWRPAQRCGETGSGAGASDGGNHRVGSKSYDALILTDSQVARPGAPGHVALEGATPALEQLLERLRSLTRVPQFALMLAWTSAAAATAADYTAAGPLSDHVSFAANAAAPAGCGGGTGGGGAGSEVPPRFLPVDAMHVLGGIAVQWVAVDSSKPGRTSGDKESGGGGQCWLLLTRPDFAARILAADADADAEKAGSAARSSSSNPAPPPPATPAYRARKAAEIWAAVQKDLRGLLPVALPPPAHLSAHRWSSCFTSPLLGLGLGPPAVWEEEGSWAACGDFCSGPGLERAAASGAAAAEAVADMLGLPPLPSPGATAPLRAPAPSPRSP